MYFTDLDKAHNAYFVTVSSQLFYYYISLQHCALVLVIIVYIVISLCLHSAAPLHGSLLNHWLSVIVLIPACEFGGA